jgi:hypothetical protein
LQQSEREFRLGLKGRALGNVTEPAARLVRGFKLALGQVKPANTPEEIAGAQAPQPASPHDYTWQSYCNGLFELPIAA